MIITSAVASTDGNILCQCFKACRMIQKLQWSGDPFEELTRIKSGLKVQYVCTLLTLRV